MKTIYIVRHAKSSWKYPELEDEKRPLLEKGKKRTKKVIDELLRREVSVDLIISSHAVRAQETAKILAHALHYPTENILIDRSVYYSDAEKLMNVFFDLSEAYNSVMIVGHNPALTTFVNSFLSEKIEWLPTSGIVSVGFKTDKWEEVPLADRNVNFILEPKKLGNKN